MKPIQSFVNVYNDRVNSAWTHANLFPRGPYIKDSTIKEITLYSTIGIHSHKPKLDLAYPALQWKKSTLIHKIQQSFHEPDSIIWKHKE